jgi:hypothetical protein
MGTSENLISNNRIFELMRTQRGRPNPKAFARRNDLKELQVFRCDMGGQIDHALVISGKEVGTERIILAIAHNSYLTRGRGPSRMFFELTPGAKSNTERLSCPIDLPGIRAIDFKRALGDPNRLIQEEVDLGSADNPSRFVLGTMHAVNADLKRHTLIHSAMFSFGATEAIAERTPWENEFEAAIDFVEAAKSDDSASAALRLRWLTRAKDSFLKLGRTALAADCYMRIAKIIIDDPLLLQKWNLKERAEKSLAVAEDFYKKVGDVLALGNISLLRIHLMGTPGGIARR